MNDLRTVELQTSSETPSTTKQAELLHHRAGPFANVRATQDCKHRKHSCGDLTQNFQIPKLGRKAP